MSLQIYDYYLNGARKMGENCENQYIFKAFALTGRIADCECTQGAALSYELLGFQPVSTIQLELFPLYFSFELYFPEKGCHLGTNRSDNET